MPLTIATTDEIIPIIGNILFSSDSERMLRKRLNVPMQMQMEMTVLLMGEGGTERRERGLPECSNRMRHLHLHDHHE